MLGWHPSCECADLLHALWLGTARDAVGSHLIEYARWLPELESYSTWDERLNIVHLDFIAWRREHGLRGSIVEEMSSLVIIRRLLWLLSPV